MRSFNLQLWTRTGTRICSRRRESALNILRVRGLMSAATWFLKSTCCPRLPDPRFHLHSKFGHRMRQLPRSPRRFPQPERNARRLAMSVFDADCAGVDSQNSPGRVAQLKYVPRHALDRKVFVDRAEECFARLEYDAIIGIVRNRATGRQRDQAGAAAPAHAPVYRVVMNQRGAAPALRAETLRQHPEHGVKFLACEM